MGSLYGHSELENNSCSCVPKCALNRRRGFTQSLGREDFYLRLKPRKINMLVD